MKTIVAFLWIFLINLATSTTIVGINCIDGVVLGADTRSTAAQVVMNKEVKKIRKLSSTVCCCGAGTSADCEMITRKLRFHEALRCNQEPSFGLDYHDVKYTVHELTRILRFWQKGRKAEVAFILGGRDGSDYSLFQVDGGNIPMKCNFAALGSGSTDAIAVLESYCRKWDKFQISDSNTYRVNTTVGEATTAVRKAIQAGILNDLGSGSNVDICILSKGGCQMWREQFQAPYDSFQRQRKLSKLAYIPRKKIMEKPLLRPDLVRFI